MMRDTIGDFLHISYVLFSKNDDFMINNNALTGLIEIESVDLAEEEIRIRNGG